MKLFGVDGPLWRVAEAIGRLITVNILALASALPILTIGASFTALYDTGRQIAYREDISVHSVFFSSMRSSFRQSTLAWMIVGPIGGLLGATWIFLPIRALVVIKALATIVYLLGFPFLWVLVARFDNNLFQHMKNAWLVALSHLPRALLVILIWWGWCALCVAGVIFLPQVIPLIVLLGVSVPAVGTAPIIEPVVHSLISDQPPSGGPS